MLKVLFLSASISLFAIAISATAQESLLHKPKVAFGAFVDTYYAYDFNNPLNHERAYLTQSKRSDEFNINLAFVEATVSDDQMRGRFALQTGTSVQSNYAGEPTDGATSGGTLSQHIQEAVIGYQISEKLWIDAGIFFAHLGFESFISRDNWTYTRSLSAEFTPYYQSGAKLTYTASEKLSAQVHVINGWQNISENNGNKAIGAQLAYTPSSKYSLTYNGFFGHEANSSGYISPRFFNQLVAQWNISDTKQFLFALDYGSQTKVTGGESIWHGQSVLARFRLKPATWLGARVEHFHDPDQVIVATGTPHGLQVWGASVNCDVQLKPTLLWRSEFRQLWSRDRVFPTRTAFEANDALTVTSLALTI